jgi:hypothetical protein
VSITLSPQIRIVALVGVLAVLGLGASMFLFNHGSSKTQTTAVSTHAATSRSSTVAHTPAKAHVTPSKAHSPSKHTTKPHAAVKHHPAKPRAFHGYAVYANLPQALQWQLAHHKVVVVSLYNPSSEVDSISVAEAHQGAIDANAGFLLVSVLDNRIAGILTALLPGGGLLPDPGVLVYRAPGDVALRLDGFADRDSVAQAAVDALNGETGPAPTTPTATTVDPTAVAAAAPATTGAP